MKQVFSNNEVPHIWANQQQESGRNAHGNFYFNGATIYSYGSHFPIATIKGNDVFFTLGSYSNTTAKHISRTRGAVSHKNFIWCNDVPTGNFEYLTSTHEANIKFWKSNIKAFFGELGNPKIRNTQDRINSIGREIQQLKAYCSYFKLPIKDKELKDLIKLSESPDFLQAARQAKANEAAATEKKMKQAAKAFEQYLTLWRAYDNEGLKDLPSKIKDLCNFYNNQQSFTRLRFNAGANRVETSKGVEIPAEIAKRAYVQLNGCMEGSCKDIAVPVLHYTITETGKDYIKAGCHTIPKEDVRYIANLLNW